MSVSDSVLGASEYSLSVYAAVFLLGGMVMGAHRRFHYGGRIIGSNYTSLIPECEPGKTI